MPTNLYEIIQLPDGDYALRRTDGSGDPLVRIRFSDEARHYLSDASVDIARVMIDAGIEAVELMSNREGATDEKPLEEEGPRTLH